MRDVVSAEQYEHEMQTHQTAYKDLTRKFMEATRSRDYWAGIAHRLQVELDRQH